MKRYAPSIRPRAASGFLRPDHVWGALGGICLMGLCLLAINIKASVFLNAAALAPVTPASTQDIPVTGQSFNTAALRKHAVLFTVAAGISAGGITGIAALHLTDTAEPAQPQSAAQIGLAPTPARLPVTAEIISIAPDQSMIVRAHVWVAQFNTVSLCPEGINAPCSYRADIRPANGDEGRNAAAPWRAGQTVTLHGLHETGNAHPAAADAGAPARLRPRQDVVTGPVAAQVIQTGDGDTVQTVADIWPGMRVLIDIRIGGIDTPEKKGRAKCAEEAALGDAASRETHRLLQGQAVTLHNIRYEKYGGRLLADIRTQGGIDIARHLAAQGLAKAYDGGTKQSWCKIARER